MKQHFYQRYLAFFMAILIIMAQASGVVLAEGIEGGSDTTVSQTQNDSGATQETVDSGIDEPKAASSSAYLLGSFGADGIAGGSSETDATKITEKETTIKIEGPERYFKFTAEKNGPCTFKLDCTSNFIVIVTDQNVSSCLEQYDPITSVNQTFNVNAGTTYYIYTMSDDGCAYDANLTLDGCFADSVVQIGDTGYKTWAEAISAINNDSSLSETGDVSQATITLLSDVTIDGGTYDVSAGEMPTKPCTINGPKSGGSQYKLSSSTNFIYINADTRFYDVQVGSAYLYAQNYNNTKQSQISIEKFIGKRIAGDGTCITEGDILNITGTVDLGLISNLNVLNLSSATINTIENYVTFTSLNLTGTNQLRTNKNNSYGIINLWLSGTITGTGSLLIQNNSGWTPAENDIIIRVDGSTSFTMPSEQLDKIKLNFSDGKTWTLKRTVDTTNNRVNYVLATPVVKIGDVNYCSWTEAIEAINNDSTLSETGDVSQATITLLSDITIDGGTYNVDAGEMPAKPCTIVGTKSGGGKYILTSSTEFIYLNANTKFYDIEIGKSLCNNSYILSSHQITIEKFKGTDNIWGYDPSNTSNIVNVSGDAEAVSIQNIHSLNLSTAHITTLLGYISLEEINLNSTNELVADKINISGLINFYSTGSIIGDGELVVKNGTNWTPAEGDTIIKIRNTADYKISSDQLTKIKLAFSDGKTWALKRIVDTTNNCVNYVLANPVASVTLGGNSVYYSTFGEAVEAINNDSALSETGDVSQATITLLSDITIDGGIFNVSAGEMPSKPCTIVGTKSGGGKYKLSSSSTYNNIFLNANTKFFDIQIDDQLHCLGYNRSLYQVTIQEFTGTDIMGDGRPSTLGDIVNITGNVDITSIQNVTGLNLSTASIKISGGCISFNALNLTGTNHLLTRRNNNTGIIYLWESAAITGNGELLIENNSEWTPAEGDIIIQVSGTTDYKIPSDQLAKIKLAFSDGKAWILKRTVDTTKNKVDYVLARPVAEVDLQITPYNLYYGGDVTVTATLKDSDGNPLNYDGIMAFEGSINKTTTTHLLGAFTTTLTKPDSGTSAIKATYTYSDAFICSQNWISSTNKSFHVSKSSNLSVSPPPGTITVPTAVSTEETKEYHIYLPDVLKLSQQDTGRIVYSSAITTNDDSLIKEISTSGNTFVITTNGGKADKTAEIDVTIQTINYLDITQTLSLKGSSSTPIMHGENIKVNGSLTYGKPLSTISVMGEIYNEASQARDGTFRWDEPDAILGDIGSYSATYTWYPKDSSDGQYQGTVDVTIIPSELMVTLSPGSCSKIYGESDPTFTYNITMGWLYGSDTLEEPVLVSDGNSGGAHNVVANSQKNTNYAITVSNGTNAFTINKRAITLNSVTVPDKTYNGLTTVPDATVTFGNVVSGDTISYTTDCTLYSSADVGTKPTDVTVILQGSSAQNYVITGDNPIAKTGKIVKATTTTNAASMEVIEGFAKEYSFDLDSIVLNDVGGSKSAGTRTYNIQSSTGSLSFAGAPTVNGNILEFTTNSAATAGQSKTVNITIRSTNYEDVTVPLVITAIEKTELTISGMTVIGKTYDGTPVLSSGVLAFKKGSVAVAIASPVIQYSGRNGTTYSSTDAPTDAGDYTLTVTVPSDNEYRGSRSTNFTISKAVLTVKPKNLSCYVGNTLPTAELVYTGFVNGETAATALTGNTLAATHTADTNTAGTFDINVTGSATAKNYAITTEKATLTVSPKIVLIISGMTVTGKTYDGMPVSSSGTLAFKKDSAVVAIASPVIQYSGRNGTVYSSTDAPTDAGDYTLTVSVPAHDMYEGSRSTNFTISKAALTVKPKNLFCYVGNTLPTAELVYTGFVNGETATTALVGTLSATHTATDTNTAGTFDINVTGSATTKNYAITTQKATLTIRAISGSGSQTEPNREIISGSPHATVPVGSLPTGMDLSNLRLLVDPLSQDEMSAISSIVAANMPASIPSGQIVEYDINFIDVAHNNAVVEPTGSVVIILPYPPGTDSSYTFTILHLVGGTEPEIIPYTNTANGIQFTVNSLSPFIIGYTKVASGSHGHSSGGRDNSAEVFWQSVEDNIQKAHGGDVISANISSSITNIPASVLETLKGKDVTLTISWQSDKIAIYGKTMKGIEKNRIFYNLNALASLYQEEVLIENPPLNPETGGKVDIAQPSVVVDADQIYAEYAAADAKVSDEYSQETKIEPANQPYDNPIIQMEQKELQSKLFVAAIVAIITVTSATLTLKKLSK